MLYSSHESEAFEKRWLLDLSRGTKALTFPSSLFALLSVTPNMTMVVNYVKANTQKQDSVV